ncbi:hypothetical protein [Pseudoduganella violaceinigra]|uniref:hypothetical protein n=1 Tax=Pseudoduganella violaceinigra TaxID=246602 RepID=UPI0003FB56C5|nr:hypothetical protein [Pseudoduganella violaceinigra]
MRIKPKDQLSRADPVPVAEAEPAPAAKGKHVKAPRPRPPRYQMAGACLLYQPECAGAAAEGLCDDAVPPVALPDPDDVPADVGDDRAEHLAMVNGQVHPMLRQPLPKPVSRLPPVRPGSRLACERRCGGAGCDPANSHGCGGEFCLDPPEDL